MRRGSVSERGTSERKRRDILGALSRGHNETDAPRRPDPSAGRRSPLRPGPEGRHRRLGLLRRGGGGDEDAAVRVDVGRGPAGPRRDEARGDADHRPGEGGERRARGGGRSGCCAGKPEGAHRSGGHAGGAAVAGRVRRGWKDRGLCARRGSLRAGPRVVAVRAADADGRGGEHSAALTGRQEGRLRARQRSLRLRSRREVRNAADVRRQRDGPEREPLLGLLGGDLRPRHGGILVVRRLVRDRVPAHGRVHGRPRHVPEVPAGRAGDHHAALPEGGQRQPVRKARNRRGRQRQDGLDGPGGRGLRIHHGREVAAGQPRGRRPDDQPAADAARPVARRAGHGRRERSS